ncbi:hypothetical protein HanIR_Chr05g0226951 [Helianthus annuus]|nr:hypothetical protein HanIR_Chr05g0226951 [Helianthus annuus]
MSEYNTPFHVLSHPFVHPSMYQDTISHSFALLQNNTSIQLFFFRTVNYNKI